MSGYEYLGNRPLHPTSYYRLKMHDLDGKFTYSQVISVSDQLKGFSAKAYPNPFGENLTVEIALDKPTDVTLDLLDVLGRTVSHSVVQLQNRSRMRVRHRPDVSGRFSA